jgi:hypothetical protein
MPVYSTLETIKGAMESAGDYVHFKILDQDENLMTTFKGLASTTPADAFTNLQAFIDKMSGEGYIVIRIYLRTRKFTGGGDTANDLKFYYRLSQAKQNNFSGGGGGGISLDMYLAQMNEANNLRMELAIEKLTAAHTKKEVKDTSYFERVAEAMGKGFAKDYLKGEGIYDEDEDGEQRTPKKKKPTPVNDDATEEDKKADIKNAFKRTGEASVKIMRVAKQMGGTYDDVAEGIEGIAELAEKNPLELKKIFDQIEKAKQASK